MVRKGQRKLRSDAGKARGSYNKREIRNPISTANMKVRFANSTSYAAKAGISSSYSYKCRDCGVLFTRIGAIEHYPQDCMELNGKPWFGHSPAAGVVSGRSSLPPTVTPHEALVSDLGNKIDTALEPVAADLDFTLDIQDIAEYLEWITEDRNDARRELEETKEELARVRDTKLSTEFWSTYREFRDK